MVRYIAEDASDDDAPTIHELPPAAFLVLLTNGRISHAFPLRDQVVEIGRDKTNSVVVADQKVSRHHANLNPIDATFILTDKGSANGTYLNGVLISQPIRLKDQDRLTVGDTTFLFTTEMPDDNAVNAMAVASAPAAAGSKPQSAVSSLPVMPMVGGQDRSIWIVVGCLGLIIVSLLVVLAILLGLFIGQNQIAGLLTGGALYIF